MIEKSFVDAHLYTTMKKARDKRHKKKENFVAVKHNKNNWIFIKMRIVCDFFFRVVSQVSTIFSLFLHGILKTKRKIQVQNARNNELWWLC